MMGPLRFGRAEIRPSERQLLVDGRPVALGGRAFDVLSVLIAHRERVVGKDELLESVWPGLVVEENNLQVQISTLRRFLGAGAITTVPGHGYQFTTLLDSDRQPAAVTKPPAMSVAIMDFTAAANDVPAERIAHALPRELTTVLGAAYHYLKVTGSEGIPHRTPNSTDPPRMTARYLVGGDVRSGSTGNSVSIRLVEAAMGSQSWSTRFELPDLDGSLKSSVRLRKLSSLLAHAVRDAETRRVLGQPLENLDAIELVLRSRAVNAGESTLEKTLEAKNLVEAALKIDPNLVPAMIEQVGNWDALNDLDPHIDRKRMLRETDELTKRAVTFDETDPIAWWSRVVALTAAGRWIAALEADAKCIWLDPFRPDPYRAKAWIMNKIGRPAEALPLVERAIALDPDDPGPSLLMACEAYMLLGRNDDAVATGEKAIGTTTDRLVTSFLVAAYANRGDLDKAVATKNEMLRTVPGYTIAQLRAKHYSDVPEYITLAEATWYAGLRKAGIPEE